MIVKLCFDFYELFNSDIAKKYGYDNTTKDPRILTNLMNLVWYLLMPIRTALYSKYNVGLGLEAGYRCEAVRKKLNASKTGHPDGECADLSCKALTKQQLFDFIRDMAKQGLIEYDQLILEHNADGDCVHIGYRQGANRKETMIRTLASNGEFVYKKI